MLNISESASINIATMLLSHKKITEKQMKQLQILSKESGQGIVSIILDKNFATETDIAETIAKSYDLPKIKITLQNVEPRAISELPKDFILTNQVLPFSMKDGSLQIAIADPTRLSISSEIKTITDKNIDIFVTKLSDLEKGLKALNISSSSQSTIPDSQTSRVKLGTKDTSKEIETTSDVIRFVDDVLVKAIKNGSSDIHIEHYRAGPRIRLRLDGVMTVEKEFEKFLIKNYPAVVTRLKIMAETNISERRLPQDGAIQFNHKGNECDFRVSFLPTKYGERVVLRLLKKEAIQLQLEKLGFEKDHLEKIKSAITAPQGLILVTGPTGSGKTTTLYSCLNHINKEGLNILTAEDPVEYELHGVSQVQVKEDIGLTFASALRSFLRQDPEVILVGEIRDKETADIAIKAALTGHLVLSTLHTNDSISTVTRLINMGVPSYLIASALTLVLGQRLARSNCPHCKKNEQIDPKLLNDIGFSIEEASRVTLFKCKGCSKCERKGYKGRQGIYEVLNMTPKLHEAVLRNASNVELNQIAKKEGYISMQEMGRSLLIQGAISFEEYQRVLQGELE